MIWTYFSCLLILSSNLTLVIIERWSPWGFLLLRRQCAANLRSCLREAWVWDWQKCEHLLLHKEIASWYCTKQQEHVESFILPFCFSAFDKKKECSQLAACLMLRERDDWWLFCEGGSTFFFSCVRTQMACPMTHCILHSLLMCMCAMASRN